MPVGNGRLRHGTVEGVVSFWDATIRRHSCLLCWMPEMPEMSAETCDDMSEAGNRCTREPEHEAAHAACGPGAGDHPKEIWED